MTETTSEEVGDVLFGTKFLHCHKDTYEDKAERLRLRSSPLRLGRGGLTESTRREKKPNGWYRDIVQRVDTCSYDPTRASSRFVVVSVKKVPPSDPGYNGRDAGYGGGTQVIVKRLDGKPERILYTRACCFNTDVDGPVPVVTP